MNDVTWCSQPIQERETPDRGGGRGAPRVQVQCDRRKATP